MIPFVDIKNKINCQPAKTCINKIYIPSNQQMAQDPNLLKTPLNTQKSQNLVSLTKSKMTK